MLKESTELFTILVQNHLQQLSGNNILRNTKILFFALAVTLGVTSCSPKVTVLRSPEHSQTASAAETKSESSKSETTNENRLNQHNIALLLPFQLNQIAVGTVNDKDVKRSGLALDFYQGFELGLEELAQKGANFNLNVLDTRDNAMFVSKLATSTAVDDASIIVGPVYPQEIKSFGTSFVDKEVLQINPLSAAMPTEYNLPNLVSLTPPIKAHSTAIANSVARDLNTGDIVIVFNSPDSDSRQFLAGMASAIKQLKPNANVVSVSSIVELNDNLKQTGNNYVIAGTTDKTHLNTLVSNLIARYQDNYYSINLFGHPLWDRYDFSSYTNFANLNPRITTESSLKPWSSAVRKFKEVYNSSYGIQPSDASYKGYDAALYFGGLVSKYGVNNIKDKLSKDSFTGIFSSYKFMHNKTWGYVNESVFFKIYRGGQFQLQ